MLRKGSWIVLIAAITTLAGLGVTRAAPMAPGAIAKQVAEPIELASFWGWPFPFGYTYLPGQCYTRVAEETPRGVVWKRVWICNEHAWRVPYARF